MRVLRANVLVSMGVVVGLFWGAACNDIVSMTTFVQPPPPAQSLPMIALLTYDLPDGSQGGPNTGLAWTTRALNTEVYDPAGIVTLSANQFTIGPGTYLIEAGQTIFQNLDIQKGFRGRLRNITNATTVAVSLDVRLHEGPNESAQIVCPIPKTLITLVAPATFELQYFCQTSDANPVSLGFPMLTGEVERYASVSIEQAN